MLILRYANVDLMISFGSILKGKKPLFSERMQNKASLTHAPILGIEHEKRVKVLCVHWSFISELYCKIFA